MHIFNGTNEILLRAGSIKDMVEWTNALLTAQKKVNEVRYEHLKRKARKDSFTS